LVLPPHAASSAGPSAMATPRWTRALSRTGIGRSL
jgi:hypothetical protein